MTPDAPKPSPSQTFRSEGIRVSIQLMRWMRNVAFIEQKSPEEIVELVLTQHLQATYDLPKFDAAARASAAELRKRVKLIHDNPDELDEIPMQ